MQKYIYGFIKYIISYVLDIIIYLVWVILRGHQFSDQNLILFRNCKIL